MCHFGEMRFSFPFPSLLIDHFDVQDLKIFLGIISFEILVASSQHYVLKCIFCWMLEKTLNFESVNALVEIEVSFIKQKRFDNL